MFAGKTSELLHRVEQYESQGLTVAIVKSNKDTRYSDSHVVTHDGVRKVKQIRELQCNLVNDGSCTYHILHEI